MHPLGRHFESVTVPVPESIGSGVTVWNGGELLAAASKGSVDLIVSDKDPLNLLWRFEAFHDLLTLSRVSA